MGIYTIVKKDWEKWSVSGRLRYNYRNTDVKALYLDSNDNRVDVTTERGYTQFNAFNRSFSNLEGSAGLSYLVTKRMALKFNMAKGFR